MLLELRLLEEKGGGKGLKVPLPIQMILLNAIMTLFFLVFVSLLGVAGICGICLCCGYGGSETGAVPRFVAVVVHLKRA